MKTRNWENTKDFKFFFVFSFFRDKFFSGFHSKFDVGRSMFDVHSLGPGPLEPLFTVHILNALFPVCPPGPNSQAEKHNHHR